MKKASNILLLINAIMGFVMAGVFGIILLIVILMLANALGRSSSSETEYTMIVMVVWSIIFGVAFVESLLSSILCIMARSKRTKVLYIMTIIFGGLSSNLGLIGGIFGLVSLNQERRAAERQAAEDRAAKERAMLEERAAKEQGLAEQQAAEQETATEQEQQNNEE